jgi:hypothetical protein
VLSPNGGESEIAAHPARDLLIGWLGDGRLAFASDRQGRTELYTIRVVGGKAQGAPNPVRRNIPELAFLTGMNSMALTRDGSLHYTSFRDQQDAYLFELDPEPGKLTGVPRLLLESTQGRNQLPAFSPDGRLLAVLTSGPSGLAISLIATQNMAVEREIPIAGLRSAFQIRWTPDGAALLIDGEDTSLRFGIHRLDLSGKLTLAVHHPRAGTRVASFAQHAESRSILMIKGDENLISVTSTDEAGTQTVLHTESYRQGRWGAISSSGRSMILYTSAGPSVPEFTIFDLPDLRRRNFSIPVPLKPASDFAWAGDDRSVYFLAQANGDNGTAHSLWQIPIGNGPPRRLGDLRLPGSTQHLSVHPSGTRIALSRKSSTMEYWTTEPLDLR